MEQMLKQLVLSYFKETTDDYSFVKLANMLGVSIRRIDRIIVELIEEGSLAYKGDILLLTPMGRLKILNTKADYFIFSDVKISTTMINPSSAWPIDKPYLSENFTSKLKILKVNNG